MILVCVCVCVCICVCLFVSVSVSVCGSKPTNWLRLSRAGARQRSRQAAGNNDEFRYNQEEGGGVTKNVTQLCLQEALSAAITHYTRKIRPSANRYGTTKIQK